MNLPLSTDRKAHASISLLTDLMREKSMSLPIGDIEQEPVSLEPQDVTASRILIVDDEPTTLLVVRKYLANAGYQNVTTTSESTEALALIERQRPDVVLMDIMMPQVSGLDILRSMRSNRLLRRIPVLVLTASSEVAVKRQALDLGATDFLAKPLDGNDLLPRVRNVLLNKAYEDRLASHAGELEQKVRQRTAELLASRREVVRCLARAGEYRDSDTGNHVVRVGRYVGIIARKLGLDEDSAELIELAAQLHDIGKIGIADEILRKPDRLDPEEFDIMRRHCAIGKRIIQPLSDAQIQSMRGHPSIGAKLLEINSAPLMVLAARIAQTHHEKWDGTGYPLGLAGEDIPIEGRMTAVADVFDALSTKRPYKAAFSREKCFQILEEGRGTSFDPMVLDAFFSSCDEIIRVQIEYMDLV